MDADPAPGKAKDFMCGPRSQDGLTGIDIAVRDLATAQSGVPVLAAADGIVSAIADGLADRSGPQGNAYPCGNRVVIDHGKGWQTHYCHLRRGSVQVRPGDRVMAGQILGAIGLSGASSWPKLTFSVAHYDTARDPFTGRTALEGCRPSDRTLWKRPDDVPYRAFAIYNLGFSALPPSENAVDRGIMPVEFLPDNAPALTFWAGLFDARKGDMIDMHVEDPRGIEIMYVTSVLENDRKKRLLTITKPLEAIWRNGVYTGTIRITRGIGKEKQISEWTAKVVVGR